MAEAYLKGCQKGTVSSLKSLQKIGQFLQINDGLKQQRIEWTLGVPQLKSKKSYKTQEVMYAIEFMETINDEVYEYKTPVLKN